MKKSCVIYDSWGEILVNLPDDMAGKLIKQIIAYAFNMPQEPADDPAILAIFAMIKTKLDEDAAKYQAKVDRIKTNSERNRNEIDTISERNQNEVGGVSVSVSVSDKDIKEKYKKKRPSSKKSSVYNKIHSYTERKIDYSALGDELTNDQ